MARNELLDNITHKDLKVNPIYSSDLGDNVGSTITFVTEFSDVQKEYPILFRKDPPSNQYQAVVLLGLQQDENLFLQVQEQSLQQNNPGWQAHYVPAAIARGPFMIGFQARQENGQEVVSPMVHVDMEHPKISTTQGVNVFLAQGGNSPYLEHISHLLNVVRDGVELNKRMFAVFEKYELIEPVAINVDLENSHKLKLKGFYTVNIERLTALDGDALKELSKTGFLQAAYFAISSLSNIKLLIAMKNAKNRA
ncbi:SapC family protein [Marinagarivorans cellulosilyticus]|nr:SapC family protein [Marinagarivorans cellulosilyticus]